MSLILKIDGLDRLTALLEKAPATVIKHTNVAILGVITLIENQAKKEAPIGLTKKLHNMWTKTFSPLTGKISSQMPYALGIEFGTAPHKVPVSEIAPWAISKGLNPWAVAKSIAKKGTRANPFFQRALDNSEDGVNKIIKGVLDNAITELNK